MEDGEASEILPGKRSVYRDSSVAPNSSGLNPFSRENNTEKLLLAREKEREYKELTRGDNDTLRVFEKGIQNR